MILTNTANALGQNQATGHKDWISRFSAIPQADQAQENEQMADIIALLPVDASCDEAKMAALINPEETTIFVGLDPSGESILLLHNLEVKPASRLQKRATIRALHGFGDVATTVNLNYAKTMQISTINCASLTNIKKFTGHDKLTDTTPRTDKCPLKTRTIIALPPFISSKLIALPDPTIDHALATVLKTITDYDRKKLQKVTIDLLGEEKENEAAAELADTEAKAASKQKASPGELAEDPINEFDDDDDEEEEEAYRSSKAASTPLDPTTKKDPKVPKKVNKASSFPQCEMLLRFLWTAAFQQKFPAGAGQLPSVPIGLTSDQASIAWNVERHARNSIGDQLDTDPDTTKAAQSKGKIPSTPEMDHLARRSASALQTISSTMQDMQLAKESGNDKPAAVEKLHECHSRMIRRLCSVDARNEREPTKFFKELSSAPGKGGTGAVIRWNLHMQVKNWNIRVTNGCITAIAKGLWTWDRATYPNNLTIFGFPRVTANDYAKGLGDAGLNLHMRANHGRDLSEKDVRLLTHQGMSYTPDVIETRNQLNNFSKCLDALIHPDSMVATNLRGFIQNIEDNEEFYEGIQAGDPLFCLRLLYKVDMVRNRIFHQCLIQENFDSVDWNICDFYKIHASVLDGSFVQLLPCNLDIPNANGTAASKRAGRSNHQTDSDGDEPPQKRTKRQSQRSEQSSAPSIRGREGKGNQVHNAEQSPALKLKEDERYGELIMKPQQLKHLPKQPHSSNTICANYHVLGHCTTNCPRKDSHGKLSTDLQHATEAWLRKCRDAYREKSTHG
jgi:hypothetical protein